MKSPDYARATARFHAYGALPVGHGSPVWYVSLHTAKPDAEGAHEVAVTRATISRSPDAWLDAEDGVQNAVSVDYVAPRDLPANGVQVTHYGLSLTVDGEPQLLGAFKRPFRISGAAPFGFDPGAIIIREK